MRKRCGWPHHTPWSGLSSLHGAEYPACTPGTSPSGLGLWGERSHHAGCGLGEGLQHTHLRIHGRGRWSLKKYLQPPPQPGQRHCQGIDDLGHLGAGERHQPGVVLEHSLAPTFTVGIYLGPCSAGAETEIMGVRGQRWGASPAVQANLSGPRSLMPSGRYVPHTHPPERTRLSRSDPQLTSPFHLQSQDNLQPNLGANITCPRAPHSQGSQGSPYLSGP